MVTITEVQNQKLTVELRGEAQSLVDALLANPQGLTYKELGKVAGIENMQAVRGHLRRMRIWFSNIGILVRGKGDNRKIFAQYRTLVPSMVVANATTAVPAKSLGKDGHVAVAAAPVQAQPQGGSRATDIVMPSAPDIPDARVTYKFFEPPDFYKLLKSKILVHSKNIALKGPPGIGKSSAYEYLAATEYVPLVNINADAGLKARHLIGGMTDNGRFEVAQFAAAVLNGWWAKIDEANGMDPDAALALNSLLAPPYMITIHGKGYRVHPNFRLCITYNPGLVGTKPLPDSLKDRFYHIPVGFPTETRLMMMMKANGVDTSTADVQKMIKFAGAVSKLRDERRIRYDITMRRLIDAWSDLSDGATLAVALTNAVLGSIDSDQDKAEVDKLVGEYARKGG